MKKVNTEVIEKMAKEKNIDKDKIQEIADGYKGKSENELMDELIKIGQNLKGKEEVVSKLKNFLDEGQRKKIDAIMDKISDAEIQSKVDSKKAKSKKPVPTKEVEPETTTKPTKKSRPSKTKQTPQTKDSVESTPTKKTKKVIKKVKKSSVSEDN
ncbi:MAG: hypothetical protein ACRC92_15395 [Peptostreptococcaceae bacterium]